MKTYYHLSHTWTDQEILVHPRVGRIDDAQDQREFIPSICVSPSVLQALVASGDFSCSGMLNVYVAQGNPEKADWVFDYPVTEEHRFREPTLFKLLGTIDAQDLSQGMDTEMSCLYQVENVYDELVYKYSDKLK